MLIEKTGQTFFRFQMFLLKYGTFNKHSALCLLKSYTFYKKVCVSRCSRNALLGEQNNIADENRT